MKKENIKASAERTGLDEQTTKLFIEFFSTRFPNKNDNDNYVDQWAKRFKGGEPEGYMDSQSKQIFENCMLKVLLK